MGAGVSWRFVSACRAGTSHIQARTPCQDNCFIQVIANGTGEEVLIAIAADGAGSAARSQEGSELACEAAGTFFVDRFSDHPGRQVLVEDAVACLEEIRATLHRVSLGANASMREYACTLVGAVVTRDLALAFQIGDGALVFGDCGAMFPVFWPESGEYANMTHFVTDEEALLRLQAKVCPPPEEVAVLTDGLQRLALVYATREAHAPFFEPMFRVLRGTGCLDDCDPLNGYLEAFLESGAVNERTDDDKTLVLATRI